METFDYVNHLLRRCDELVKDLRTARKLEVNNFLAHEDAKEKMLKYRRDFVVAWVEEPNFSKIVDPRTGKSNKDWYDWVLERRLEADPNYVEVLQKFYNTQREYVESQGRVMTISEELQNINARLNLLSTYFKGDAK